MTNSKGAFEVKRVPNGKYEVEMKNIGFERLKVSDDQAVLLGYLKQTSNGPDEMVVKGYYTTTNRLNTGDVSTVKGEEIQEQPASDPILAFDGANLRTPGWQGFGINC